MTKVSFFKKIDSRDKAYILGLLAGDGHLSLHNQHTILALKLEDKSVISFVSETMGGVYSENHKTDKLKKIFPHAKTVLYSKEIKEDLFDLFSGRLKKERCLPKINKELVPYMILGFFDAEGCITWGYRKDKNRLWQKVSITSQPKMLEFVREELKTVGIDVKIKNKGSEDCSVIEFSNDFDVFKFKKYLPSDCFHLKRKENNFSLWEDEIVKKYTFIVGDKVHPVDKRTLLKFKITPYMKITPKEYIVTKTEGSMLELNDSIKIHCSLLRKAGNSNYILRSILNI